MTWTKISDDFTDDTWTLSDAAFRLHVDGLVWSNRKLLDLRIPKEEVRRFAKHPDAVDELLDGNWWRDEGDAYVIVHHSRYQRSKLAVINQQEVNKSNRAKRGKPTPATREQSRPSFTSNDSLHDSSHEKEQESSDERDRAGYTDEVDSETGEMVTGWASAVPGRPGEWVDPVGSVSSKCRLCDQAVRQLDAAGLCSKVTADHAKARRGLAA